MSNYSPKKIFRVVSNKLLKEFFLKHGHGQELEWDKLLKKYWYAIFACYTKIPENIRQEMDMTFQEVFMVASDHENLKSIHEEAKRAGIAMPADILESSAYDQCMWACLNHERLWDAAIFCANADKLPKNRWFECTGFHKRKMGDSPETWKRLGSELSSYMLQKEGRGTHSKVEYFERSTTLECVFVYMDDYGSMTMQYENDTFDYKPNRKALEILFVVDHANGKLCVNTTGDREHKEHLLCLFSRVVFGDKEQELQLDMRPSYCLDGLKDRNFQFPLDPSGAVVSVSVKALGISLRGCPGSRRVYAEQNKNLYEAMEKEINRDNLPVSMREVETAKLQFKLRGFGRSNSQTININRYSSDLRDRPEKIRRPIESCLKTWGIDVA